MNTTQTFPQAELKETAKTTPQSKKENPYLVTFKKPYYFEDKEYTHIDLSALEEMTSQQLFEANREMAMDYISPKPEADARFCCIIAGRACGLPTEFFDQLPIREGIKIRDVVFNFFHGED